MKKTSVVIISVIMILVSGLSLYANGSKEVKTSEGVTVIKEDPEKTEVVANTDTNTDVLSKNVAIVNLIKPVMITSDKVDEAMALYEQYGVDRKTIVDSLIEDELLSQAIERDGYSEYVTYYAEAYISQYRDYVNGEIGRELTDDEFEQICFLYNGSTSTELGEAYAKNYVAQSYVQLMKSETFENAQMPTDEDINLFYNQNLSSFVSAENVKLSHIFFLFGENKDEALTKATNVADLISSGSLSFNDAVVAYSDDTSSKEKNGDIGSFSLSDTTNIEAMGQNFVNSIFKLEVGKPSGVIESNVGYHIVLVTEHNDSKFLSLNDQLSEDGTTVSEYIKSYLVEVLYNDLLSQAYEEVVSELKTQASVRYLEEF